MISAVIVAWALRLASLAQGAPPATSIDVSALKVSAPTTVIELDLGKLKGELRQVGWAPDGTQFYIQTADGPATNPKLRHYAVAIGGGAVNSLDTQPDWARSYWEFKSDRSAPGIGSLMIDVEQRYETLKAGTGPAGALDREGNPLGGVGNVDSLAKGTDQYQKQLVTRLKLFDEAVSEFVNQKPIPGLMFSWGPEKSGAIAFTDRDGRLLLLDQKKHKQSVSGAKDALLPAWSIDGKRLAWVQKSGRKKFTLVYAAVGD
jgi:hypothetical protein